MLLKGVSSEGLDVLVDRDVGPVLGEDLAPVLDCLALEDDVVPCSFEAEVEASDPCE